MPTASTGPGSAPSRQTPESRGPAPGRLCRALRSRARALREARAALLGLDTTPCRWMWTWRVTHTSSTAQVATIVPTTDTSIAGAATHDSASAPSTATFAQITVNDTMSTARTAALLTGSAILGVPTPSSVQMEPPPRPGPPLSNASSRASS